MYAPPFSLCTIFFVSLFSLGHGAMAASSKIGLAWALSVNPSFIPNFRPASFIHTWSPSKPDSDANLKADGLEFIPMLHSTDVISDFSKLVVQGYASKVFGFYEPNVAGSTSLDPPVAVSLWNQLIQPLKSKGYGLISPAVTPQNNGKQWLQSFINECSACTIDGVAIVWYGTDPTAFINDVESFFNTFKLPVWVIEFGCQDFNSGAQCTLDQNESFIRMVKTFMDSTSWISGYFAFGILPNNLAPNSLITSNGELTELGDIYLGISA